MRPGFQGRCGSGFGCSGCPSFASSFPVPNTLAQNPRFFFLGSGGFDGSVVVVPVVGSTAGAAPLGGSPAASTGVGAGPSLPKRPANLPKTPSPGCSGQSSTGCRPRTKYSV